MSSSHAWSTTGEQTPPEALATLVSRFQLMYATGHTAKCMELAKKVQALTDTHPELGPAARRLAHDVGNQAQRLVMLDWMHENGYSQEAADMAAADAAGGN